MHGAKYHMDKNVSFQKMMALYPMWNNKEGVNQFQLDKQVAEVADVLPEPEKVFVPPAAPPPADLSVRPSELPAGPGGAASQQNLGNQARSIRDRTGVEAGSGRQIRAREAF
jgi:hypothetical protein